MSASAPARPAPRCSRLVAARGGRLDLHRGVRGHDCAFGPRDARAARHDRRCARPRVYPRLVRAAASASARPTRTALWDSDDLVALLRIGAREMARLDRLRRRLRPVPRPLHRLATLPRQHPPRRARATSPPTTTSATSSSRRFLDPSDDVLVRPVRARGSVARGGPASTSSSASAERLELAPDDHLLEIGTGWGGFAVHAAAHYGCRVTTTTISREQHEYAPSARPQRRTRGPGARCSAPTTATSRAPSTSSSRSR